MVVAESENMRYLGRQAARQPPRRGRLCHLCRRAAGGGGRGSGGDQGGQVVEIEAI